MTPTDDADGHQATRRAARPFGGIRRRTAIVCVLIGVVLLGVAGGFLLARNQGADRAAAAAVPTVNTGSVPTSAPTATSPATTSTPRSSSPAPRQSATARPRTMSAVGAQLSIPRLSVGAPIQAVGTSNDVLDVPLDPGVLGWWNASALPGSGRGSIVVDGHINYNGVSGALSVLPELHVGDNVMLRHNGRTITYYVAAVRTYVKAQGLPAELFTRSGPERLVLITCGGAFDSSTGNYEDNIVAFATPA